MARNRRWISREEIAEIYDAIALKKAISMGECGLNNIQKITLAAQSCEAQQRAEDLRATERLGNPVGSRA